MSTSKAVVVQSAPACAWAKSSLRQGFDLSTAVLDVTRFDSGVFHSFISRDSKMRHTNFDEGGMALTDESRAALARYLDDLSGGRTSCLIVEDDLRRRADPLVKSRPGSSISFIGDRIVHWCDRGQELDPECVDVMKRGASGYPLNAFVSTMSAADLGLVDGQDAPEGFAKAVAESLLAVVVAAFDAETFLVWDRRPLPVDAPKE